MYFLRFFFTFSLFFFTSLALTAELKVVATTSTMSQLVQSLGGEKVDTFSLTSYLQDPHFIEPKPSYMVKLRNADLLVSNGLELEIGWLDIIRRGARNPELFPGKKGYFEAGQFIKAIEVPVKIDRSQGDVHPSGNPHFHLDPIRVQKVAHQLSAALTALSPENKNYFEKRLEKFSKKIETQMSNWKTRIKASGVTKVVTFHKSFNYFLTRFGISLAETIEPKPGLLPNAKHTAEVITLIKQQSIKCILVSIYHEGSAAVRHIENTTQAQTHYSPLEAKTDYFSLIEELVQSIESCGKEKIAAKGGNQ